MEQDKEKMLSLMIDHIDGKLTGELSKYVENHINKSEEARKEYEQLKEVMQLMLNEEELEPGSQNRQQFLNLLETEKGDQLHKKNKIVALQSRWGNVYKIAAAVSLIVLGFLFGKLISRDNGKMDALQAELQETKELVLLSMMKQESASERIKGVMASYELDHGDDEIINALINTMNTDDNINVRIASVEALGRFSSNEKVKSALIEALAAQEYPAVQIRLIDILVQTGDKKALEPMQKVAEDEEKLQSVRDLAQMGVFKLTVM